jgi:hypothetical protein
MIQGLFFHRIQGQGSCISIVQAEKFSVDIFAALAKASFTGSNGAASETGLTPYAPSGFVCCLPKPGWENMGRGFFHRVEYF